MERDRDIYRQPGGPEGPGDNLPAFDRSPAQARARARRSTIGFILLMLAVFAITWVAVYVLEQRNQEREALEGDTEGVVGSVTAPQAPPVASLAVPDLREYSDSLTLKPNAVRRKIDREKIAKAMGEVRLAKEYLETRQWDGAEEHARKALDIWPDMNAARRLLGFLYTQRGQFDQAILVLEDALQSEPFSAETFNNLAAAYMQKWQLEKAEDLLTTALEIRPDFAMSHINLGLLYVMVGRYEDTIDHLERALELAPSNMSARNNLGVALIRVGRYAEAREQLQYVIEHAPERPNAYFNMAISYILERDFDQAMKYIRRGSRNSSPVAARGYLSDSDFDPIRNEPAFQTFINNLYPELPQMPPMPGS